MYTWWHRHATAAIFSPNKCVLHNITLLPTTTYLSRSVDRHGTGCDDLIVQLVTIIYLKLISHPSGGSENIKTLVYCHFELFCLSITSVMVGEHHHKLFALADMS